MIAHIAFGIVIDDIRFADGREQMGVLGGGGPQTAWGMAAALGTGESVGLLAQVGEDFDNAWLAPMHAAHINCDGVLRTVTATPRAWQIMDADGARTHQWSVAPTRAVIPDDSLALHPTPLSSEQVPRHYRASRHVHWGLHPENPALGLARALTESGVCVSLETFKPPPAPLSDAELSALVSACTIFSPNWGEAQGMTGGATYADVIAHLRAAGCSVLALRRGARGADVWDFRSGERVRVPAVPSDVVDTVGAGNAFCGAFITTFEQGITQAACHAVAAASYMIEQIGVPAALPASEDYARRLAYALERCTPIP
jgi:cytidine kinase